MRLFWATIIFTTSQPRETEEGSERSRLWHRIYTAANNGSDCLSAAVSQLWRVTRDSYLLSQICRGRLLVNQECFPKTEKGGKPIHQCRTYFPEIRKRLSVTRPSGKELTENIKGRRKTWTVIGPTVMSITLKADQSDFLAARWTGCRSV